MMKDTSHPWNPYAIEPPGSSIAETSCTNRSGAGAYADSYPYPPSPARARSLAFSRASASFSSRSLLRSARTLEISWKCLSNARLERPALSTLSPKNARPAHTKTTKFFETVTAFVGSPELRLWRPTCLRSRRSEPVVNRRLAANGRADFETEPSTSVSPYRLDAESSSRRDERRGKTEPRRRQRDRGVRRGEGVAEEGGSWVGHGVLDDDDRFWCAGAGEDARVYTGSTCN